MEMVKNGKKMLNRLSNQEVKDLYGGYAPPSEEQLEALGPLWRDIICW